MSDQADLEEDDVPAALGARGTSILKVAGAAILVLLLVLAGVAIGANFWPHVVNVEQRVVEPVRLATSRQSGLETVPDTVDESCGAIVLLRRPAQPSGSAAPPKVMKPKRKLHKKGAKATSAPDHAVGFFVTPDGYVLTATSVLPQGPIEAVLSDGHVLPATREGVDLLSGLALLKVDESDLPVLRFAEDGFPRIGQTGLAVAPAGSRGCVARTVFVSGDFAGESEGLRSYLRLQEMLDENWAGVPILNLQGRVVGIAGRTAEFDAVSEGSTLLPGSIASHVADRLVRDGTSPENRLGFEAEDIGPTLSGRLAADRGGAVVSLIDGGSAADMGGLKAGDIIVAVNDQPVSSASELARAIDGQGSAMAMQIQRRGEAKLLKLPEVK